MADIVHVRGPGTIGEPLAGVLLANREAFNLGTVTVHKRTAREEDRPMLLDLQRRGAVLSIDDTKEAREAFSAIGVEPEIVESEALAQAGVVIDCTPAARNVKESLYEPLVGPSAFLAQGSEYGFGTMYAYGINDEVLTRENPRFIHVVSCNTHNIGIIAKTLGFIDGKNNIERAYFVCIRRANDLSQHDAFIPSPKVDAHAVEEFGTHHARDAHELFATLGEHVSLTSSSMQVSSQYMHIVHFRLRLYSPMQIEEVRTRLANNYRIAFTKKRFTSDVFSFGRDHGFYGRIFNQTVIVEDTLAVQDGGREIVGYCFTPQDANSIVSSIAATLWGLGHEQYPEMIREVMGDYFFKEV